MKWHLFSGFLKLVGYKGESGAVHLFYSSNADKLTFDIHLCINASKARVFYYKVETEPKMPWISSWRLTLVLPRRQILMRTILSSATMTASTISSSSETTQRGYPADLQPPVPEHRGKSGSDLLPASCKDDADEVMACINEFKSKQGINNALVKQFGNKKGSEIYRAIKGLLKN